jgi:PKD repeat protein
LGSHSLRARVTDSSGTVVSSASVVVSVAAAAEFSAAPSSGTAPLAVQFVDTSTGSPSEWAWDF